MRGARQALDRPLLAPRAVLERPEHGIEFIELHLREVEVVQEVLRKGPQRLRRLPGEHGDTGDYATAGSSSTSRSGYQRLNTAPNSRLRVLTRVCSSRCAPRFDHCICCFLQKRLLTTWFAVDSTKPVAMASPCRYH